MQFNEAELRDWYTESLMHFGVPGMKWGRRKSRPVSARKAARQKKRYNALSNRDKFKYDSKQAYKSKKASGNKAAAKAEYKKSKKDLKATDKKYAEISKQAYKKKALGGTTTAAERKAMEWSNSKDYDTAVKGEALNTGISVLLQMGLGIR